MKLSKTYPFVMLGISSLFIVGCSGAETAESTTEASPENNRTEKNTYTEYVSPLPKNAPVYKVATEASYAPFVLQDSFGKINGLDVDLIRTIGETQGFKVEFHTMPWEEVYPSLNAKKYDIAMSGIHIKESKKDEFGMSDPYLKDTVQIVSKKISGIASIDELSGKTVGVQAATVYVDIAKGISNITVVEEPTVFSLFEGMAQNKIDAFLTDRAIAVHMSEQFPEINLAYSDAVEDSHGIAFYTNKDNQALLATINAGLTEIKKNGQYNEINKKWFGNDADKLMIQ